MLLEKAGIIKESGEKREKAAGKEILEEEAKAAVDLEEEMTEKANLAEPAEDLETEIISAAEKEEGIRSFLFGIVKKIAMGLL